MNEEDVARLPADVVAAVEEFVRRGQAAQAAADLWGQAFPWNAPFDAPPKCFVCGQPMAPWWNTELPVPHDDERQWHPACFDRWVAFYCGWRQWGGPR